ncbi:DUF2834 domain-containing protein [Oscillatoria sp. CS-180]|uniref:DUF2834 domain-containing protein n=1 Tax=Oscillatoria sp. CS-180 TaxID=3021720 RepID=UPI00232C7563|nr:DUF2834 domain-containing protein [Oscillatoria sp. CS-180]MDB9525057.1 DUF2834 domain-containing protein [Oscillatoria sp. CS-180]
MLRRAFFAIVWLAFTGYAFVLAPPDQPNTATLIQKLATGDWADINPAIVALFNLMGVWPIAYACLALIDGDGQKTPAWPFVLGSFGFGAFLLLPYLILRQPNSTFSPPKSRLLALVDSRWLGLSLLIGASGLLGYGFYAGDWSDFVAQWQNSRFIHVMSLDFCLLWLLVPSLLGDDMARRGLKNTQLFSLVSAVPLIGLTAYLAFRPPLPENA